MGEKKGLPVPLGDQFQLKFPRLTSDNHKVTSPRDSTYNCIAYAAGVTDSWWEPCSFPIPGYYWPSSAGQGFGIDSLQSCYEAVGYEACSAGGLEEGYTKIVLYADDSGRWTHAARQLSNGCWSSKLGRNVDICHDTPEAIAGAAYGNPVRFMRKSM